MDNQIQLLRVVVASPGDVPAERDAVSSVVEEINRSIGADRRVRLEVIRWETDTHPGFHPDGPQGLIDPILRIEDSDLLIGIFWKRFGTPTKDASSGTEHEIRFAIDGWRGKGQPQVFIYFNDEKATPKSAQEALQWAQVLQFRDTFPSEGLWSPYTGVSDFERLLRVHLTNYLRNRFPANLAQGGSDATAKSWGDSKYFAIQKYLIEEHTRSYVGRDDIRASVENFLKANACGYLLIHGAPGQGKTSFCADLIRRYGYIHHFVGVSGGRGDVRLMLQSLLSQLVVSMERRPPIPDAFSELTKLWEEVLIARGESGATAIVLDGLDELAQEAAENLRFLLPERLPPGIFLILALRPGRLFESLKDQTSGAPCSVYRLGPLSDGDIERVIEKEIPAAGPDVVRQVKAAAQGNPLYVRSLINELQKNPKFDISDLPSTLEDFFRRTTRFISEPGGANARKVLAILSTAYEPLCVVEMQHITGLSERDVHEEFVYALRPFLSEVRGAYRLYHRSFLEFFTQKLLFREEIAKAHAAIADWLMRFPDEDSEYRWRFLSHHLVEAEMYAALEEVVSLRFLEEKSRRYGYGVLDDIECVLRATLRGGRPGAVEKCVRLIDELRSRVGEEIIRDATRALNKGRALISISGPLLPFERPVSISGIDIYVASSAGLDVSADFHEIVPTKNGCIAAIGDAPGTGLKSSFVGRFLSQLVRSRSASEDSPRSLLESINVSLSTFDYFERVSMQCISVDLREGVLTISNAGHPALVHFSKRRGECDPLDVPGELLHDSTRQTNRLSDYEDYLAEIDSGDVLVMVTDGLLESHRIDGGAYGYKFTRIVEQNARLQARQIGEAILADWRAISDVPEYRDDVLLVVLSIGDRSSYLAEVEQSA